MTYENLLVNCDCRQADEPEGRRHFEEIVADGQEGIAVLGTNGLIGYANAAAEFLLGRYRADLTGEMFGLPSAASDRATTINVISRDDVLRLLELRIEPLANSPQGTFVLRFKDVTDYHRNVLDARDEVRRRDEFLAMLSHELRNPLAAIRSAAMLLAGQDLDSLTRGETANVLNRQFGHLTRILDDLLDVTRILRGKLEIVPERVELNLILRDAAEAVAPLILKRGHTLRLDLPHDSLYVLGDATRLEQIAVNLLNNAAKFTSPGGNISLSAVADAEEVEIRVRDNGPGIPVDLLPRIFEPFVQGTQKLDRSDGGLGIGLMLVRTFVTLHGGSIRACTNADGPGMSFFVRLPLVAPGPPAALRPIEEPEDRSLQILLVEDNADARRMLKLLLQKDGHDVIEAENGPDGLSIALERLPDVALVDIGLPGMDGYELARRVRQEVSSDRLRLVALTGYGTPEDVQAAHDAGFDDHRVKPVDFSDLSRLLRTYRMGKSV